MSPFRASAPLTHDWKHFGVTVVSGVLTITLDRPERLNALTFDSYADLRDLFVEVAHRDDVRAVVITGAGRAFCSGGDVDDIIGALLGFDAGELLAFTRMTGAVIRHMRACPIPIVAAVNGVAAGAGAVLALAADFRILSTDATFRFLFTQVGLAGADMGAAYLLPRLVGVGRATEMLMFGDPVNASDAHAVGLANRVVEPERLGTEAMAMAQRIADGPALAYQATKVLLGREQDLDLAGAVELEAVTQAHLMHSEDFAEFHAAFTAKRPPRWSGR